MYWPWHEHIDGHHGGRKRGNIINLPLEQMSISQVAILNPHRRLRCSTCRRFRSKPRSFSITPATYSISNKVGEE